MTRTQLFTRREEGEWTDRGGGSRRRVILHTDELMLVDFAFEQGAVDAAQLAACGQLETGRSDAVDVARPEPARAVVARSVRGRHGRASGSRIPAFPAGASA